MNAVSGLSRMDTALSRISAIRSEASSRRPDAGPGPSFASVLVREQQSMGSGNLLVQDGPSPGRSATWAASPFSPASGAPTAAHGLPATAEPTPWADTFASAAARHDLPAGLLEAVARVESGLDPDAVSPAGAQGLMQFMPATAAGLGVDPFDPPSAIDGAARYLAQNRERFGSIELALAAYNAGPGAVQRHGGIPPYTETQRYVAKVLDAWGTPT